MECLGFQLCFSVLGTDFQLSFCFQAHFSGFNGIWEDISKRYSDVKVNTRILDW